MTIEEFAKAVRLGNSTFPVNKVVLIAENQRIPGRGVLRVSTNSITLEFEATCGKPIPRRKSGLRKPEEFWQISGLIDGDLRFWSKTVDSVGSRSHWGIGKMREFVHLDVDQLECRPRGIEALTPRQRQKIWGGPLKSTKHPAVQFTAVLVGCKQVFWNAETRTLVTNDFLGGRHAGADGDTFIDRNKDYDFALIRRNEDLHVHFRSKADFCSRSEGDDWRRFTALLKAVGLTHGVNAWPYSIEYWRGDRKITHRFTAPRPLTRTPPAPFDQELGRQPRAGRKGARNSVIRLAASFFEQQTPFVTRLGELLFLFREAGNRATHFHLRTLAVCSIFESVVSLLFEALHCETALRSMSPQFEKFSTTRDKLVDRLRRISRRSNDSTYERLASILSSVEAIRVKDRYKAVCDYLGLDYKAEMKRRCDAWISDRNALAHGTFSNKDTDFENQSLIAGAINILALKAMGYSGLVMGSAFEPFEKRYQRI